MRRLATPAGAKDLSAPERPFMLTTVFISVRRPWKPAPELELVDLAQIGTPNSAGLVAGPGVPFHVNPVDVPWIAARQAHLRP